LRAQFLKKHGKLLLQCDFDGTVTIEDASFAILDACIPGKWRNLFDEYQQGRLSVGAFNTQAFSMVRAEKKKLLEIVDKDIHVRNGFTEFINYCRSSGFRIVFVSNGLDFYIEHILKKSGFPDMEIHASVTTFTTAGTEVRHKGPDGRFLDNDVKAVYADSYKNQGYTIVYLGDGHSDISPARKCDFVFATGSLIGHCRSENIPCMPFDDFHQVVRTMELWQ